MSIKHNMKILRIKELNDKYYKQIGISFSKSAKSHNMTVQTCYENNNLVEYGFIKRDCLDMNLAFRLTGKTSFKKWKARKCNCVEMVDIGVYNSGKHFCKYCYANYEEKKVLSNMNKHNPKSSLLIGDLELSDTVKIRK